MGSDNGERLHVSPVAFRSQITITHPGLIGPPDIGMGSPIFRLPEFVRHAGQRRPPGYTAWDIVEQEAELRFHWAAPREVKDQFATDFRGHLKVEGESVRYEITYTNTGDEPATDGVSLFCLQAGTMREFHDPDGLNTFVWGGDGFRSINELVGGRFNEHRMAGANYVESDPTESQTTRKLMVKRSKDPRFVLAVATDPCSGVGGNFNVWPSCIHSNPDWGVVGPGEEATVRGRVYFMRGGLDDVLACYVRDFET